MNQFATVLKLRRLDAIKHRSQVAQAKARHKGCIPPAFRAGPMSLQAFIQALNGGEPEAVPLPAGAPTH